MLAAASLAAEQRRVEVIGESAIVDRAPVADEKEGGSVRAVVVENDLKKGTAATALRETQVGWSPP